MYNRLSDSGNVAIAPTSSPIANPAKLPFGGRTVTSNASLLPHSSPTTKPVQLLCDNQSMTEEEDLSFIQFVMTPS